MLAWPRLDPAADAPLYRQLYEHIRSAIISGKLAAGARLPATRELAGRLGLNRTTVSAAYALLESEGLITGHVGRGSFVADRPAGAAGRAADPEERQSNGLISFSSSRPSEALFPLDTFRETCTEVIMGPAAGAILQLGSPIGYGPLREYLLDEARRKGMATAADDIAITSGCQQAIDLIQRTAVSAGDTALIEDPVYPGLRNAFSAAGVKTVGVAVGPSGVNPDEFERAVHDHRPRVAVVTPDFQNPTGVTLSRGAREHIARIAQDAGVLLVENNIYSPLRYEGEPLPAIRQIAGARTGTILIGSFSKIAFPGLRVGWVIGPRAFVRRLAEAKQFCDLHTDHLSQAVLLRFAESGRLAAHLERVLSAGRERLQATLAACARHLPAGSTYTRPQGGMNAWVELPGEIDSASALPRARRAGVAYLPGNVFAAGRDRTSALRLSFAGLTPEQIEKGLSILGEVFRNELQQARLLEDREPAPALV
ncbi:MAG TPA: PLP-dependent aminotransferase family protein [Bryobacteraceae bacterium]|jgi:2-aminoadipate transaminase|nr:PLP-dependent aminotransferase family protein [Bryobacteraceae bacterium]